MFGSATPLRPNQIALANPQAPAAGSSETPSKTASSQDDGGFHAFGPDGFTFLDMLDIINPLQHIPVVSTLYRAITGDTIEPITSGAWTLSQTRCLMVGDCAC